MIHFSYAWYDDDHRALVCRAGPGWSWRDYHACALVASYALNDGAEGLVDMVIDLRPGARERLPAGARAHVRTFGKRLHPRLSGRAIVIGCPPADIAVLDAAGDGQMATPDGAVWFVADDDAAVALLAGWRAAP
jgi:hypothetical protein